VHDHTPLPRQTSDELPIALSDENAAPPKLPSGQRHWTLTSSSPELAALVKPSFQPVDRNGQALIEPRQQRTSK
jgi:hypothetical protein